MLNEWVTFVRHHHELYYVFEIAGLIVAAWVLRKLVFYRLRLWAERTTTTVDDQLVDLLDRAVKPLLSLGVLAISLNMIPLSGKFLSPANRILKVLVLAVFLYYGAKIVQLLLEAWLSRSTAHREFREPASFVARVIFVALGMMIVLDNLGISLTAVWTTLGVGSVAVALALQDTLSNFFAGVYLRLDNPVRVGDYIKLESGEEGYAVQLGWRSARIRTLPNNVVIVPNAKLASTILTNYTLPEPRMSLLVSISVSYQDDAERVEQILIEEATAAAKDVEGLLADPAPFVRFIPGFGESSLDFTLICQVASFVDQYLAQHELRKRILARFRREHINIPFPQRDLHVYAEGGSNGHAALATSSRALEDSHKPQA
jgi:small-conductance mechanosensitive channel